MFPGKGTVFAALGPEAEGGASLSSPQFYLEERANTPGTDINPAHMQKELE